MQAARCIPVREVPKDKGILQDVRWFIRAELRNGKTLDQIQGMLEESYPGKDFHMFLLIWKRFHPDGGVILRDAYKSRVKTADTDTNWRV